MAMADDLERMEHFRVTCITSIREPVRLGVDAGIKLIVAQLNDLLKPEQTTTVLEPWRGREARSGHI